VVPINSAPAAQPRSVTIRNLLPGEYGVCCWVSARPDEELGVETVGADGSLHVKVPADSVLTIDPHLAQDLPPTAVGKATARSSPCNPARRAEMVVFLKNQ